MDDSLPQWRERIAALKHRLEAAGHVTPSDLAQTLDLLQDLAAGLEASARNQAILEQRLERVENSVVFRTLRGIGGSSRDLRRKLGQALLHSPLHPVYARLTGAGDADPDYQRWIAAHEHHPPASNTWAYQPLISIVVPVYNPNPDWLEQAIQSVRAQTYDQWQLCLSLDGPAVINSLEAQNDPRIQVIHLPEHRGISAALNNATQAITGEYVAFLDQDDLLSPYALHHIVEALQNGPADLLYSDEDHLNAAGARVRPNFKPDWSPDLLNSCMYMGHLLVVSRERLDEAGWFRSEYDGAQDYDLALRLARRPMKAVHLRHVLYHWRMHDASTAAAGAAKPYAHEAGRRALEAATGHNVQDGPIVHTYVIDAPPAITSVAIIVCTRNSTLLDRCLQSLTNTTGGLESEIIVVHHTAGPPDPEITNVIERFGCRTVRYHRDFNFAEMNNLGAQQTTRDALLFLNDDVTATQPGWLQRMLRHLDRNDIGAAGAKLLYPSGAIQHAGIVLGIGEATGHIGRHQFNSDLWPWLHLTRNVSAVTAACMATRRSVFEQAGGFDTGFAVNYNDVDLCLRLREAGYDIIYEASAILQHDECSTRASGTRTDERERFYKRWGSLLRCPDPYYSPSLNQHQEEITLQ